MLGFIDASVAKPINNALASAIQFGGLIIYVSLEVYALVCLMQNFLVKTNAKDASGNTVLGDIGVHIQQEVS